MRFFTLAGPASSGKTSLILRTAPALAAPEQVAVVKFDCGSNADDEVYVRAGLCVHIGLAEEMCPDHFYAVNIRQCAEWGQARKFAWMIAESAGLCNRCVPHIAGVPAVCVIDCLSGMDTPRKIGPMLRLADAVVLTKGDMVSPIEREVFAFRVGQMAPRARIFFVNALNGQGVDLFRLWLQNLPECDLASEWRLRTSLPQAVCSYCFGQTIIGFAYQRGDVRVMPVTPPLDK